MYHSTIEFNKNSGITVWSEEVFQSICMYHSTIEFNTNSDKILEPSTYVSKELKTDWIIIIIFKYFIFNRKIQQFFPLKNSVAFTPVCSS